MSKDNQLQQAVLAELNWEPSLSADHIGVMAHDGIVTLNGHVTTFGEKHAAEAAAARVKGVKAVAEKIEVRLPFDSKRDDDEIAAAAVNRLAWDSFVPRDAVKVLVENGWVTLTGEVAWRYQKQAAEQNVRRLLGVTGVSNQIGIKLRVNAANLNDDIMHALHRSVFFDPKTISVSAEGGDIRLTGTVHSLHERQVAAATAWSAPGACTVENDIRII
jgi:osmotically-inducible protein OsmY